MLKWTDKEIYIEEECSRRTAWLICNYELAGAVRKQTERTVNEHVRTVQGYTTPSYPMMWKRQSRQEVSCVLVSVLSLCKLRKRMSFYVYKILYPRWQEFIYYDFTT
jgi:hypothetical protein